MQLPKPACLYQEDKDCNRSKADDAYQQRHNSATPLIEIEQFCKAKHEKKGSNDTQWVGPYMLSIE
ncbi:hypothetical protein GCM10027562_29000 [Arthrobacter pigmenti]